MTTEEIIQQYNSGTSISNLSRSSGYSRSGIYSLLKRNNTPLRKIERNKSNISDSEIISLFKSGKSILFISNCSGLSMHKIRSLLLINGVILLPKETEDKIINYYKNGISGNKISNLINCPLDDVYSIIKKYKLIRNKHCMSGALLDEFYFNKIDNENKAYWLGFLLADGYVSGNKVGLSLSCKDKSHLEKFKKDLSSNASICTYTSSGFSNSQYCRIIVFSNQLSSDLIKNECVPHKSLVLKFPHIENVELIRHLIRGYVDGDGSIVVTNKAINIKICGTGEFLTKVVEYFNSNINNYEFKLHLYQNKKMTGKNNYYISFGGKNKTFAIVKWLYENSNIYLERKYKKYLNLKDMVEPIRNGGC